MKVVIDTNVFISGVFWKGVPHDILVAWRRAEFGMVVSPEILEEYRRVLHILNEDKKLAGVEGLLDQLTADAFMVRPKKFKNQVCRDADDDKFLEAAVAGKADFVVTGDRALLEVRRRGGIQVLAPRMFLNLLHSR